VPGDLGAAVVADRFGGAQQDPHLASDQPQRCGGTVVRTLTCPERSTRELDQHPGSNASSGSGLSRCCSAAKESPPDRVLALHRGDRVNSVGASQERGIDLGKADVRSRTRRPWLSSMRASTSGMPRTTGAGSERGREQCRARQEASAERGVRHQCRTQLTQAVRDRRLRIAGST
jgi:hypothetical protein